MRNLMVVARFGGRAAGNRTVESARRALGMDIGWLAGVERSTRHRRMPSVLTRGERARPLAQVAGMHLLTTRILYSARLHLTEFLTLRVKHIDVERMQIVVRDAKGQ